MKRRKALRVLRKVTREDNIFNGAAAIAYYLFFSIFPAALFVLTLMTYLPLADRKKQVMQFFLNMMPESAASTVRSVISSVFSYEHFSLLSLGFVLTLWSGSSGIYSIIKQLNVIYGVTDSRPFWKVRGLAVLLMIAFAILFLGAFGLVVSGNSVEEWFANAVGIDGGILMAGITILRWLVVVAMAVGGVEVIYWAGPDVDHPYCMVSRGSFISGILFVVGSLGFEYYVNQISSLGTTYGILGGFIVLMIWLYLIGLIVLLGAEVNTMTWERAALRR